MAERQRHRKVKLEPISLEELAQTPGLTGMLSYLQRPPNEFPPPEFSDSAATDELPANTEPAVVSDTAVQSADSSGAPELSAIRLITDYPVSSQSGSGAPEVTAPALNSKGSPAADLAGPGTIHASSRITAPSFTAPEFTVPSSGAVNSTAPELAILSPDETDYVYVRQVRYTPVRVDTVQDGHTHGEQALYATLWRLARRTQTPSVRSIIIGERTLAAEVPMSYSSVQDNLRALVAKHSIAIIPRGANRPKTYLVYDYDEVLRRRRAAGLLYAIRRTSSVTLVTYGAPELGAPYVDAPSFGAPLPTTTAPKPAAPRINATALTFTTSGAPSPGASYIGSQELISTTTTLAIAAVLREELAVVDNNAAERIVAGCRAKAPDATDEEISTLCREQARRYRSMRSINNPVGMLIRQLPSSFEGAAFAEFRKAQRQLRTAENRRREVESAQWRRVLDDTNESEEMKAIAREALEHADNGSSR
jgi:hypothetical protein